MDWVALQAVAARSVAPSVVDSAELQLPVGGCGSVTLGVARPLRPAPAELVALGTGPSQGRLNGIASRLGKGRHEEVDDAATAASSDYYDCLGS